MATIAKLPIGHTETLSATYTVQESDMGREDVTCTATARSKRTEVEGTSAAITMEAVRKALKLTKTVANTPADGEAYAPGEDVEFDIKTENTGNQTLSGVEVTEQTDGVSIVEGDGYTLEGDAAKIATIVPKQFVTVDSVKHVQDADVELEGWTNTAQGKIGEIIQSGVSPVVYFAKPIPQDFTGLSWDSDIPEISAYVAKKPDKGRHLIEKEKTFTTSGLGTFTAVCVDIAHFKKYDDDEMAGLCFQFKETTSSGYKGNSTYDASNGYPKLELCNNAMPLILESIQKELANNITDVKFSYNTYNGNGEGDSAFSIKETHAKLFPASNREIWGTNPLGNDGSAARERFHTGNDGTQLAYWSNHTSIGEHIKYKVGTREAANWWLRSCGAGSTYLIYIITFGYIDEYAMTANFPAVAPIFNI